MSDADIIEDLKDVIKGERVFLHDLSNSLLVAQGMGSFVLTALEKEFDEEDKIVIRMQKSTKAVDKMIDLINARRAVLRDRTVD